MQYRDNLKTADFQWKGVFHFGAHCINANSL